jgi:hypothetical protein
MALFTGMYEYTSEKMDQADWKKTIYQAAVLTLFFICIIGIVKWRKMRWQGM